MRLVKRRVRKLVLEQVVVVEVLRRDYRLLFHPVLCDVLQDHQSLHGEFQVVLSFALPSDYVFEKQLLVIVFSSDPVML